MKIHLFLFLSTYSMFIFKSKKENNFENNLLEVNSLSAMLFQTDRALVNRILYSSLIMVLCPNVTIFKKIKEINSFKNPMNL